MAHRPTTFGIALCLAIAVTVSHATPTQSSFPANFHVWHEWKATNPSGGNLEWSTILTEYNGAAGYQCDPLVTPMPQDNPVNPSYQPFQLLRSFWNATSGMLYTASMNASFDVTCTNKSITALPDWAFPKLAYQGANVVDNRDVYIFAGNGTGAYTSASWAQQMTDGQPVRTILTTTARSDQHLYNEFYSPAPHRFANCNETWIVSACSAGAPATCSVYRDADVNAINAAIGWVCGPDGKVDCGPISPGGDFYEPNTPIAHGDWAFTQYFYANYESGGIATCCFGPPGQRCIAAVAF